jgi:hypothetical protein
MQRVVTGGDESGDGSGDGSETLLDKDFSKSDELTLTSNENHQPELLLQAEYNYEQEIDSDSSLTLDSLPEGLLTRHLHPSPHPSPRLHPNQSSNRTSTATPTRQPQVFRVGDRATTQEQKGRWLLLVVVKS